MNRSIETRSSMAMGPRGATLQSASPFRESKEAARRAVMNSLSLAAVSGNGAASDNDARDLGVSPQAHPAFQSAPSASTRVAELVKRAMASLESDRAVAWRCLSIASTMLGAESADSSAELPDVTIACRSGGLAAWQAKRALAYIEANLGAKLQIHELAAAVALSKSHFSRAFKRTLGFTPGNYVVMRRVARAQDMMTSTQQRLIDIALACGFADQPHLNRYFRRLVGVSPGVWRRNAVPPLGLRMSLARQRSSDLAAS